VCVCVRACECVCVRKIKFYIFQVKIQPHSVPVSETEI